MNAPTIHPMPESLYEQVRGPDAPECGGGVLIAQADDHEVVLPLIATDVAARLVGPAATVVVEQRFRNDRSVPLECVYVFPLPEGAAVSELTFVVGARTLVAELVERVAAEQRYLEARDGGRRAALLTQERADVFTVRVASIQPGEEVAVRLVTTQLLAFDDCGFVFRLPLVLAPRYTPLGVDLDQSPRLLPSVRPAQDLSLSVMIDPGGLAVTDLRSSQHATATSLDGGKLHVTLARRDELPNRDFVLRIRLGGAEASGALWEHVEEGKRWLLAVALPPADPGTATRVAREVVLLVDTSGSMGGTKMPAAIAAARLVLRTLEPGDSLQVAAFSSRHRKLWRSAQPVDDDTIAEADRFLAGLSASGGTEILSPLQDVLAAPSRAPRHLVLVTDGQVGNEDAIVRYVAGLDQRLTIFTIGIDTAVHAAFLRSLARHTGGLCALMTPSDPIADRVTRFLARVGAPVATDVRLQGVGRGADVVPDPMPDLYLGEPVVALVATDEAVQVPRFSLQEGAGSRELFLPAPCPADVVLRRLHEGARVSSLADRFALEPSAAHRAALLAASLQAGVLCPLTGFVVVDPTETSGVRPQTMHVPVLVPDAWASAGGPPPAPLAMAAPAPGAPPRARMRMGAARKMAAPPPPQGSAPLMERVRSMFGKGSGADEPEAVAAVAAVAEAAEVAEVAEVAGAGGDSLASMVLGQRLDGSFAPRAGQSAVRATVEALRRMLDSGSTDATGTWRSHVAKAARWLFSQLPSLTGAEREAALAVLERWAEALGTDAAKERVAAAR